MAKFKKKAYIIVVGKNNEISLEKAKFIHPLVMKTKKRIVIKTVRPFIYKKRELYFVYEHEPHTYNPQTGEIVSPEIFEFAKKIAEKKKLKFNISEDIKIPEDLTPHGASEQVIGLLINEYLTKNFLKSFLTIEKEQVLKTFIYFLIGLVMGVLAGWSFPMG